VGYTGAPRQQLARTSIEAREWECSKGTDLTTEDLADELEAKLTDVKQLLRMEFPGEDFRPPGKTLNAAQVGVVRTKLANFLADKRSQPQYVFAPGTAEIVIGSVEHVAVAPRSSSAGTPRTGDQHRILLHGDVVRFLEGERSSGRLKASVHRLLREMLVEGRSQRRVKGTKGANAGWLRAPLGDNGGYHYYLYHALQGQKPVKDLELERRDVVVRAVRHHDKTDAQVDCGLLSDYTVLDAREYIGLLGDQAGEADALSVAQRQALNNSAASTITKGHPGAGKTTLQLERTRHQEGQLLFVTFGKAQTDQAARWLRTFLPEGVDFDVSTHERLFRSLDPNWTQPPPIEKAIRVLTEALQSEMPRLGPWRKHLGALYGELRAHFWGRSLPLRFRGKDGVVDAKSRAAGYLDRRVGALGKETAACVVIAANALSAAATELLFGDLQRVFQIASSLAQSSELLPAAIRGVGGIYVDEVQDLTLVEVLVFVLVAHASARVAGRRPVFHCAGDEGQTVRPTDFDWGELKDLITLLLGPATEFDLPGNVRSPKTITCIINNSWSLYKTVAKAQRPRGYAEAAVEESAVGTVLWVDAASGFDQLLAIIARTPGAALVYPGQIVPADVLDAAGKAGVALTLAAPEAKGLDFRVVFVLDVGREAQRIESNIVPPAEAVVAEIEDRSALDSIRVALSRATEVLVFVERPLDEAMRARLKALCSDPIVDDVFDGVVTDVSLSSLEELLDVDVSDRSGIASEMLSRFEQLLGENPTAALRIAAQARQWLGDSNRAGSVQGRLRKDVYLAHGRALLRVGIGDANEVDVTRLLRSAATEFSLAEERDLAGFARDARRVLNPASGSISEELKRIAVLAADVNGQGARDAHGVLRRFAATIESARASDLRGWTRIIDNLEATIGAEDYIPELASIHRSQAERAAEWCLTGEPSEGATKLAERVLPILCGARPDLEARVAERQKRFSDAVRLFRQANLATEALRVLRNSGDEPRLAVELARETGSAETPSLERLARIHEDLSSSDFSSLTKGEREHLEKAFRTRLGIKKK
jgi:hypothetical protein